MKNDMITQKTWSEFRQTGLLWFVNSILHTFGWAIVLEVDAEDNMICYPARVKFRGFDETRNTIGYQQVSQYMKNNAEQLYHETNED